MTLRIDSVRVNFNKDRIYVLYDVKESALANSIAAKIRDFEKTFAFLINSFLFFAVLLPIIFFGAQVGLIFLFQNLAGRNTANMDGHIYTNWFDKLLHADLFDQISAWIILLLIAKGIFTARKQYSFIQINSSKTEKLSYEFISWIIKFLATPLLVIYLRYQFGWSK